MNEDDGEFDAWYSGEGDCIRVRLGAGDEKRVELLDIRDAVYFRYLLDGAISDYEKQVGR